MPTMTAERSTYLRSDQQVRAARAAAIWTGVTTSVAAVVLTIWWMMRKTWRRVLPAYWAGIELGVVAAAGLWGLRWTLVALVAALIAMVAGGWPAGSLPIRVYRITVAGVFGLSAVVTTAAGPDTLVRHPTLTVFGPALAAAVFGWPWWHHLRTREPESAPEEEEVEPEPTLTEYWADRWQHEVIDQGVCGGTRVVAAHEPRPGVTEATVRLAPGTKLKPILNSGPDIEVALDLNEGAIGWRRTGRAAKIGLVIVERSYIADGVPWQGTTYDQGRCQVTTFTDGTPGWWTFLRSGFGTLNGLVIGSTGAGKSRVLGVLIRNLLEAGWMVPVGDPQNGQSLPAWRDAAGEYHQGADPVRLLLRRLYAEVMRRSEMLAEVGVAVFDEDDPRVQKLGLKPLAAVIDECQMVLLATDKPFVTLVEDLVATCRKTGVAVIFATQIPQMKSLGGSIRIRDALVAGNCLAMRLSNRGSGTTILPDDFVGDPFALPQEINGKTTAGMGYLRNAPQLGMLSRVAHLDEDAAAATAPHIPVEWQVPPIEPDAPLVAAGKVKTTAVTSGAVGGGAAAKMRAVFGLGVKLQDGTRVEPAQPTNTREWVLACLRRAPASAQALLDRPDCPVRQPQLYAVLDKLVIGGFVSKPTRRGEPYTIS